MKKELEPCFTTIRVHLTHDGSIFRPWGPSSGRDLWWSLAAVRLDYVSDIEPSLVMNICRWKRSQMWHTVMSVAVRNRLKSCEKLSKFLCFMYDRRCLCTCCYCECPALFSFFLLIMISSVLRCLLAALNITYGSLSVTHLYCHEVFMKWLCDNL